MILQQNTMPPHWQWHAVLLAWANASFDPDDGLTILAARMFTVREPNQVRPETMFEKLITCIREKVDLSAADAAILKPFFIPKKVRKRQYILNAGDVCQYITFVEEGLLRSFTVDADGNEHVVQFAIEGWWISDVGSFVTGNEALCNIEALENCKLLHLTNANMEELMTALPVMERFFRLLMQNNIVALQRRVVAYMSLSAEEKYLKLMEVAPDIMQRAAQQHIASYLSITPETLSRVRKKISERK